MSMITQRAGYGIVITRADGTWFFASTGVGISRATWDKSPSGRKAAVKHARELRRNGFKCKVRDVVYAEMLLVVPNKKKKPNKKK